MSHIDVKSERVIQARPQDVYATLADYRKRPQILTPHFLDYSVEQGGQGSGTVVSYRMRAAGRERPYRMRVEESEKGRVITERDTASSLVTTWTLVPVGDGQRTRVILATTWEGGSSIGGFFERTFAPVGLHRIYSDLLGQLAQSVEPAGAGAQQEGVRRSRLATNPRLPLLLPGVALALAIGVGIGYLRKRQKRTV